MSKSRNITDFFRPYAQARPRCPSEDELQFSAKRCSTSPAEHTPRPTAGNSAPSLVRHSSELSITSSLTSLASNEPLGGLADACATSGTVSCNESHIESEKPAAAKIRFGSHEPVLTSSQRVTRKGEVFIRNSDDESDMDGSLEDLEDIIANKREDMESPLLVSREMQRTAFVCPGGKTRSSKEPGLSGMASVPNYKFSMAMLVAQAQRFESSEVGIAQSRQIVDSLDRRRAALQTQLARPESNINQGLLVSIMEAKGNEDNIDKLMNAIDRTEALHRKKSWSFFDSTSVINDHTNFPSHIENCEWEISFSSKIGRQDAFATGYVKHIALKDGLTDEILSWVIATSLMEPTEIIQDACIEALAGTGPRIRALLDPSHIDSIFRRLGARASALDLESPITLLVQTDDRAIHPNWSRLRRTLTTFAEVAKWMETNTRTHTLCVLCRLVLDSSVSASPGVLVAFQNAFESLITSIRPENVHHEISVVLSTIYPQVADSGLRLQLAMAIPATTARLILFRRRLCLAFFLGDAGYLTKKPRDVPFSTIRKRLRRPEFSIHPDADYSRLKAAIGLLEIGLDDGDPPNRLQNSQAEDAFNRSIDRLSEVITGLFTKIVDSGASHMSRTEAKVALEAFHSKLEFSVRTKPKSKMDLFGNGIYRSTEEAKGGDFMRTYFSKKQDGNVE